MTSWTGSLHFSISVSFQFIEQTRREFSRKAPLAPAMLMYAKDSSALKRFCPYYSFQSASTLTFGNVRKIFDFKIYFHLMEQKYSWKRAETRKAHYSNCFDLIVIIWSHRRALMAEEVLFEKMYWYIFFLCFILQLPLQCPSTYSITYLMIKLYHSKTAIFVYMTNIIQSHQCTLKFQNMCIH